MDGVERGRIIKVELSSFEDLALIASMMPIPLLNYAAEEGVAFILLAGLAGTGLVYYSKIDKEPQGRFVHVNKLSAKVSYGDNVSLEPNHVSIPILKVKRHSLGEL